MSMKQKNANLPSKSDKNTDQQAFEDMSQILAKLGKARTRLALEQRLVFDAAAAATGAEVAADIVAQDQAEAAAQSLSDNATDVAAGDSSSEDFLAVATTNEDEQDQSRATQALSDSLAEFDNIALSLEPTEVLFIDGSVPNVNDLLTAIPPSVEVFILDSTLDGVEQIASALEGRTGIDAIHIISHGESAELQLGNATLTTESMRGEHGDELAAIGRAMSEHGDILVYGCNFGEGDQGKYATDLLAELTGADIAASDDLTGSADLGGDWDLETLAGEIEAKALVIGNWDNVLATDAAVAIEGLPDGMVKGEDFNFVVNVDNTGTVGDIGYFPFVDVWMPEGTTPPSAMFGQVVIPVEAVITYDSNGVPSPAVHPFGNHDPLPTGVDYANATLYVYELPILEQTGADVEAVTFTTSFIANNASNTYGTDKTIHTASGFQSQDRSNTVTNYSAITSDIVTVEPATIELESLLEDGEDENSTGPSHPFLYQLSVNLEENVEFDGLTINNELPDNIVYNGGTAGLNVLNPDGTFVLDANGKPEVVLFTDNGQGVFTATANGFTVVMTDQPVAGQPNSEASGNNNFSFVLSDNSNGTANPKDIVITYEVYIPELDANGDNILRTTGGADAASHSEDAVAIINQASLSGRVDYTGDGASADDYSFTIGADNGGLIDDQDRTDDTIFAKALATQKDVALVSYDGNGGAAPQIDTLPSPGDLLEWSIRFQVSDYYELNNVVINDTFSDGHDFFANIVPTYSIVENGQTVTGTIPAAFYTLTENADGTATIVFDFSGAAGQDGVLTGDLFSDTGISGETEVVIQFYTEIQENYDVDQASADTSEGALGDSIDIGDVFSNQVQVFGMINHRGADGAGGAAGDAFYVEDTSSASIQVAPDDIIKEVVAVNGAASTGSVQVGDTVTYHIQMQIPFSDAEELRIRDYGDFANLDLSGLVFSNVISDTPAAGTISLGTAFDLGNNVDAVFQNQVLNPTLVMNETAGFFELNFGTFESATLNQVSTIDLYYTVSVSDNAVASGTGVVNEAWAVGRTSQGTTWQDRAEAVSLDRQSPNLLIDQRVVNINNQVAEDFAGQRGITEINTSGNLDDALPGDEFQFQIAVTNSGTDDAFDVAVQNTIPVGFAIPTAGSDLGLVVTDGNGNTLTAGTDYTVTYTNDGAGNPTSFSVVLTDDVANGSISDVVAGDNQIFITYNLVVSGTTEGGVYAPNAVITQVAAIEGGNSSTVYGQNRADNAGVRIDSRPVAVKDESLANDYHNNNGVVTLNVTDNDTNGQSSAVNPSEILLVGAGGDGKSLTVANEGTWTANNDGSITFTPLAGFLGDPAPISYSVGDAQDERTDPVTVTIEYIPYASNDVSSGNVLGTTVTQNILSNDTHNTLTHGDGENAIPASVIMYDPDGNMIASSSFVVVGEGKWSYDSAGLVTFTPEAGFNNDPRPITYTIQDDEGNVSNQAQIRVDYRAVARDDISLGNAITQENGLPTGVNVTLDVLANDGAGSPDVGSASSDAVDPKTVQFITPQSGGVVTDSGRTLTVAGEGVWTVNPNNGAITFNPNAGFNDDPSVISYTVADEEGFRSNVATVTVDYVPVASDDTGLGQFPTRPVIVDVLGNDTDGDVVDPTTVQIVGADRGSNGQTLTVAGQGVWTVDAVSGAITFTPQVAGINQPPAAIQYTVEDHEGNVSAAANVIIEYAPVVDLDVDNSSYDRPGTAVYYGTANGEIYQVNLEDGTSSLATDSTLVNGDINALATNPDQGGIVYYGNGTSMYYWDPVSNTHQLLADLAGVGDFAGGSLDSGGAAYYDGNLYIASEDVNGDVVDVFRVELSANGQQVVSVTALGVPSASGGSLARMGDLIVTGDGDDVTIYGSTSGLGFWTFDTATSQYTLISANYPGQLAADELGNLYAGNGTEIRTLDKATGLTGAVVANTAAAIYDLTGVYPFAQIDPDGTFGYNTTFTEHDPAISISDLDTSVVFDLDDTNTDSATIVLTNAQVDDILAVGVLPAGITAAIDNSVAGQITVTLTADNSDTVTRGDFATAIHAVTFQNTSHVPDLTDRLVEVVVTDNEGHSSNTAVTRITVIPVNDPPVAVNDSGSTAEDVTLVVDAANGLLNNDSDIEGDALTVTGYTVGGTTYTAGDMVKLPEGDLTILANGSYTFAPAPNYNGTLPETITYTISDGNGGTATANLAIFVTPVNDAPVVVADNFTVNEDHSVGIDVLANDSDLEGDALTITMVDGQAVVEGVPITLTDGSGTVALTRNGTLVFTAANDYVGNSTFTYTVSDGTDSTQGTVSGAVASVADRPIVTLNGNQHESAQFAANGGNLVATLNNGDTVTISGGNPILATDNRAATDAEYVENYGSTRDVIRADRGVPTTLSFSGGSAPIGTLLAIADVDTPPDSIIIRGANGQVIEIDQLETLANQNSVFPVWNAATSTLEGQNANNNISEITVFDISGLGDITIETNGRLVEYTILTPNGNYATTFTEGDAPVTVTDATGNAIDVEDDIKVMTIQTGSIVDGSAEHVTIAGHDFDLSVSENVVALPIGGSSVDVSYDATTGLFSIINNATDRGGNPLILPQADMDLLLQQMVYENTSDDPTPGDRTLTFVATDATNLDSAPAISTITVIPVNDAPTVNPRTVVPDQADVDRVAVTDVDVTTAFSDAEGDTLTYTATGLPAGLTLDLNTGIISGTPTKDASQGGVNGVHTVVVTANDGNGGTVTDTFTWTVANPGPTALDNDMGAVSEDAGSTVLVGNALTGDTGAGVDSDPDGDTLVVLAQTGIVGHDLNGDPVGGLFSIDTAGVVTFDPNGSFEDLADGQTRDAILTYTISDGQGGTSSADITVTVEGVNDAPTAVRGSAIPEQRDVDGVAVTDVNVTTAFNDIDVGDILTYAAAGLPDGLTLNPTTGVISGTPTKDASQGGLNGVHTVVITATDRAGLSVTDTFSWTVTNPGPVAQDNDFGTISEEAGVTNIGNALVDNDATAGVDTDPDGDLLTVTAQTGVAGTNGGIFSIDGAGVVTFDPNGEFENLGVNETRDTVLTYEISDGQGGRDTATITIRVSGVNDVPTLVAGSEIPDQVNNDADGITVNVSGAFTDVDRNDFLTYTAVGMPAGLSLDPKSGNITGEIDASASQGGPNNDGVYTIVVTANDANGGTVTDTFTWTVSNPVPLAFDNVYGVGEDDGAAVVGNALLDPNAANETDYDPDGDALFVEPQTGIVGSNGGIFAIDEAGIVTFDPNGEFNGLAAGETQDTVLTYTITDREGGTDTATVTVTVTGANDDPIIVPGSEIPDQTGNDADPIQPIDVSGVFGNTDTTNVLAFTAVGLPTGISIDPVTGVISGIIDNSASQEGPNNDGVHSVTITADDGQGGTVTDTFIWTVANPAPEALDNVYGVTEDDGGAVVGNALTDNGATGTDNDPDGDDLAVLPQTGVVGSQGGIFAIDAAGVVTFDPNGEFEDLAVGVTKDTTLSYTITDNEGGTSTALITVTVTGVNDAPVATPILDKEGIDATDVSLNIAGNFSDVDGDPLTFTAVGLPTGLTMSPEGVISGTIDPSASVQGPFNVSVTADDSNGGTVTTTFVYTVTNPAPTAVDDTNLTDEDTAISVGAPNGVIESNDTDPDGDQLTVIEVNGNVTLIGSPVIGDNGGTFTLNPDGSYDFDPGNAFQDMGQGETRETSIYYTISDGEGGTDIAQLTITVDGVNDTPVITGPLGVRADVDQVEIVPLDTTTAFSIPDGITLTYSAENLPEGLVIDPVTGLVTGTPDRSASVDGPYTVTISGTTPDNAVYTTEMVWNVSNPGPVANNDIANTPLDTPVSFTVIGNDTDPDGDDLHIDSVTQPENGTIILNPDGTITYTPNAGFSGTDTASYVISDGEGGFDTGEITIEVGDADPTAPVVTIDLPDQSNTDGENIVIDISGNFSDPTGQGLTFHATDLPSGLTIDPVTGIITGDVDTSASVGGIYKVTVTATTPDGHLVSTTFDWAIVNLDPVASDDGVVTPVNTPVSFNVLSNDHDTDGDVLFVESVTQPTHGTVTVNADGSITYTPHADYTGSDSFTYTVTDRNGGTDTATVTIGIDSAVPGMPVVDTVVPPQSHNDGDPISVDLFDHFSDPEGEPLIFSETGLPPGLSIDPVTGIITGELTPDASQEGPYNVSVTATDPDGNQVTTTFVWTVENPGPDAVDNQAVTGVDTPVTLQVLADDTDPEGDPLSVQSVTPPAHGQVVINDDGTVTYTPNEGYEGTDTFTYTISDGNGGTDVATVTIEISPEAPVVVTPSSLPNLESIDSEQITPFSVAPAFETQDTGDSLTYVVNNLPEGLVFNPTTGEVSGTLTPSASVSGPYEVEVIATDETGAAATITFDWVVTNPAPTAVDDGFNVEENEVFNGDVTPGTAGQDSDPDGDVLTVNAVNGEAGNVSQPVQGSTGGTFIVNPDGSYSFDPGSDFDYLPKGQVVTSTLEYTITDSEGGVDIAVVTATITGVNDEVVIVDPQNPTVPPVDPLNVIPPQTAIDNGPIPPLDVSPYFGDPDNGTVLTFVAQNLPEGLILDPQTGVISGTPAIDASVSGPYTVIITATDPEGDSISTNVIYLVENPAPLAITDFVETPEDTPITGDVSVNDHDPDGDALSFIVSQEPNHGIVTMNPDGSFIYTPKGNYNGADSFTYTVIDADGASTTETVNITILPVNDAPVAIVDLPDQEHTVYDNVSIDVSGNFSDIDADRLTYTETGLPDGLEINYFTGVISGRVAPEAINEGIFTVTITVNDGNGGIVSVDFIWNINPVDYVPDVISAQGDGDPIKRDDIEIMEYDADGIIVRAVNDLRSLGGTELTIREIRDLTNHIERTTGVVIDSWNVTGLTGFSLRMGVADGDDNAYGRESNSSNRGQIIVETLVRERTLYIEVKNSLSFDDERRVQEYKVKMINGKPLPSWLRYTGNGLLIGERPVHSEVVQLQITAVMNDGSKVHKGVQIQTQNGEIQTAQLIETNLKSVDKVGADIKRMFESQE